MKKTILFLLLCIIAMASGCPKTVPKEPAVISRVANYELAKFDKNMANYECAVTGTTFDPEDLSYKTCGTNAKDPTKARQIRDDVIYQLIRATDYNYFQFENDLYVKRATGSVLADIIDTSANFAATITNGERAKTIINAAIISFRGGRKSVSLNYFREQTGEILITKMQTSRNRVLKEILTQLKDKDIDKYPLDAALGDVIRYFYAGTLPKALQQLQQDTSVEAQQARQEILILKDVPIGTPATQDLRNRAVIARGVLKKLLNGLTSLSASVKTASLGKLQSIAEKIKGDTTIADEMNNDPILKALLGKLTTDATDGAKLAQDIQDIREEGFSNSTLKPATIDKIDNIIVDADKNN